MDVYDLQTEKTNRFGKGRRTIGLPRRSDAATQSDGQNKKLISTRDWFFSDLHRRLMNEYFEKNGMKTPKEVQRDFAEFDKDKPEKVRRLAKAAVLGTGSLFSQTVS